MPKNPSTAIVHEYEMRHHDGAVCRYRVTFDPQEAARYLANYARSNKSRKATECSGAIVVQCLSESKPQEPRS
jgi:hypothetical protein